MFSNSMMFGAALVLFLSILSKETLAQCLTGYQPSTRPNLKEEVINTRFEFAFDTLLKTARMDDQDNLFFSPHSLHQALLLAYFGARGTTETALVKALHIPEDLPKADVMRHYSIEKASRNSALQGNSTPIDYEYQSANRLWIADSRKVRECMLGLFSEELEQVNFKADPEGVRTRVNNWVSNMTKNHINDLIPVGGIDEDTDLVLANAVYFKGLWQSRFDSANSKRDLFYASGSRSSFAMFMRQKGNFNYVTSEELGAHVLQLPYKGEDVSMYILLPPYVAEKRSLNLNETEPIAEQDGIRQLIERIAGTKKGAAELRDILEMGMPAREVEVSLPRFSVEKDLPLGQLLQSLGAGELLVPGSSDLSGFLVEGEPGLHLGDAVHRARVDVTEEGTTAAAATALFSFRSSRPTEPAIFNANHPFLYLIYDNRSRSVLFFGVYRTPPGQTSTSAPA